MQHALHYLTAPHVKQATRTGKIETAAKIRLQKLVKAAVTHVYS
jgi:hypothetical protein